MGFFDYLVYNFIRDVQHEKNEQKRKTKKFYQKCMQECATEVADFGDAILKSSQKIVDESDPLPKEYTAKGLCEAFLYSATKYSLQGTTQSRYLTGGVPPVRFSM